MIISVDGPGGSGKTTVSREVARRLNLPHLDTGALYRAATLAAIEAGLAPAQPEEIEELLSELELKQEDGVTTIAGRDVSAAIRSEDVTADVSAVSAIPEVRAVLVDWQRRWVADHGGSAVVEGRDIGSVVFPNAELKIFLTAAPEVRASRRAGEGADSTPEAVAADLARRDRFDSNRQASPLRRAEDAITIDTSRLEIVDVVQRVTTLAAERGAG